MSVRIKDLNFEGIDFSGLDFKKVNFEDRKKTDFEEFVNMDFLSHYKFGEILNDWAKNVLVQILEHSIKRYEEFVKQFPYKGYSIYCSFYTFLRNAFLELQMEETVKVNDRVEKCEKEMNEQMKLIEIICFFIEEIPNFLIENEKEDLLWYIEYKKHWY